ncbi:MAG: XRE family transcriptional regulator [Planctomycetota bacterium]|nr:MAG: XRE family transcriptional regulator [Planctomycetota bacterium]
MSVSDYIRRAIEDDDRTVHALARDADCSPIQIWRFLRDERGLTTPVVDRLCEALGLELRRTRRRRRK